MDFNIHETDVIIVGAGPSGLMMACQLLRFGVQPIVIDSRSSPSGNAQSIALQARSMELFRQMGIVDELIAEGVECKGITVQKTSKYGGTLKFNRLNTLNTPFPFITITTQDQIERTLINQLTLQACPIYWNTALVSLKQDYQQAEVELNNNGNMVVCKAKWVVGADGIDSKVRQLGNLPFEGNAYNKLFFQADVEMEKKASGYLQLFLYSVVFFFISPLPNAEKYRLMGSLPKNTSHSLNDQSLKATIDEVLGAPLSVKCCDEIQYYSLHSKVASRFGDQRSFLIGDAAHVHSPFGGHGVNIGMQDAYNLSWKLANVMKGKQDARILQSYEAERRQLAVYLMKVTDRMFRIAINTSSIFLKIKNFLVKKALQLTFSNHEYENFIFSRLSQIDVRYRNSTLSIHHTISKKIKAGDRVPYLPVFDEKTKTETDLHRWCEKPGFTLILIGNLSPRQLLMIAKWSRQKYVQYMHLFYLPFSDRNQSVFDAFEIRRDAHKMVLVRPDMYIGYMQDVISANLIDNYMLEIMEWKL